jgi:hypothetical protein
MLRSPAPEDATGMHGRVCLVTGATSGIGRVTAAALAPRVIRACTFSSTTPGRST